MRNLNDDSFEYSFDKEITKNSPKNSFAQANKGFILTQEQKNSGMKFESVFNPEEKALFEEYTLNQENLDLSKDKYNVFRGKNNFSLLYLSNNLQDLDLSNNNLLFFPIEVIHLIHLKRLKLDYNYIKTLPLDIQKLLNLDFLSISNNNISALPENFKNLHLKVLNIGKNFVSDIEPITSINEIEILYLYGNTFIHFPTSFYKLKNLKELALEWFKYAEPGINPIIKRPQNNKVFEKLFHFCESKDKNKIKGIEFLDFLKNFSTEKLDFLQKDSKGRSLLHNAATEDEIGVIYGLVFKYPKLLNLMDKDEQTPLSLSILEEKFRSAETLIELGAEILSGGGIFGSCLHIAISKLNTKIIEKILKSLSNKEKLNNFIDMDQNTPIHILFSIFSKNIESSKEITKKLIEFGIDPNQKNKEKFTALHLAIKKGQLEAIRFSQEYNKNCQKEIFNFNKRGGNSKWSLGHLAAFLGNHEVLHILQEANMNFFLENINFQIPLKVSYQTITTIKTIKKAEKVWILKNIISKDCSSKKFSEKINDSEEIISKNMLKKQQFFRNFVYKASFENLHPKILKLETTSSTFVHYFKKNSKNVNNSKKENICDTNYKKTETEIEDIDEFQTEENLTQKMLKRSGQIIVNNNNIDKEKESPKKNYNYEISDKAFYFTRKELENVKMFEDKGIFIKEIRRIQEILNKDNSNLEEKIECFIYLKSLKEKICNNFLKYSSLALPSNLFLFNESKFNQINDTDVNSLIITLFKNTCKQNINDLYEQYLRLDELKKNKNFKTFHEELKIKRAINEIYNYNLNLLLLILSFEKYSFDVLRDTIKEGLPKIIIYDLYENSLKNFNLKKDVSQHRPTKSVENVSVVINNNFFFSNIHAQNKENTTNKKKHAKSFLEVDSDRIEKKNEFKSFTSKPYFLV